MALVDLCAILPFYLGMLFTLDLRFLRALRLLRIFKLTRYSTALSTLLKVLRDEAQSFGAAFLILFVIMIIASSGVYLFEHKAQPEAFSSIPEAAWWSVATLTTVGYGDVTPVTVGGKIFGIVIMIIGIGMVALPAGILASAFSEELRQRRIEYQDLAATVLEDGQITPQERQVMEATRIRLGLTTPNRFSRTSPGRKSTDPACARTATSGFTNGTGPAGSPDNTAFARPRGGPPPPVTAAHRATRTVVRTVAGLPGPASLKHAAPCRVSLRVRHAVQPGPRQTRCDRETATRACPLAGGGQRMRWRRTCRRHRYRLRPVCTSGTRAAHYRETPHSAAIRGTRLSPRLLALPAGRKRGRRRADFLLEDREPAGHGSLRHAPAARSTGATASPVRDGTPRLPRRRTRNHGQDRGTVLARLRQARHPPQRAALDQHTCTAGELLTLA